jgi:hypothetical protein
MAYPHAEAHGDGFWNLRGLYILNCLSEGDRFNAASFVEQILSKFELLPDGQFAKSQKKIFTIDTDNCPIDRSQETIKTIRSMNIQIAPHPPYSPDLELSDFFLFDHLKERMIGLEFESPEDLLEWIRATLDNILKPVFEKVFMTWIERLETFIQSNGAYI